MNSDLMDRIEDCEYKYNTNYSTIYSLVTYEKNKLLVRNIRKKGFYYGFTDPLYDKAMAIVERYCRLNQKEKKDEK
jgi:hypothetical protein